MKTIENNLDRIIRELIVLGYDMGKKQQKTPYEYTCDTNAGEKYYLEILKIIQKETKELTDELVGGLKSKLKIGENEYACKQLKLTMKEIKDHNNYCKGFDDGYKDKRQEIINILKRR